MAAKNLCHASFIEKHNEDIFATTIKDSNNVNQSSTHFLVDLCQGWLSKIVMISAFVFALCCVSNTAEAKTVKFKGWCEVCGDIEGVYTWGYDDEGNKVTVFESSDGKIVKVGSGHKTFITGGGNDNPIDWSEFYDLSDFANSTLTQMDGSITITKGEGSNNTEPLPEGEDVEVGLIDLSAGNSLEIISPYYKFDSNELEIPISYLQNGCRYAAVIFYRAGNYRIPLQTLTFCR